MAERSLARRVEILEHKVESLEELPARVTAVELQVVQLRDDLRAAFSAIDGRFEAIDGRFEAIDRRFEAIDRRFDAVDRRFGPLAEELRAEMRAGDEETRRYMRVLHEEVLARLALLQNATPAEEIGRRGGRRFGTERRGGSINPRACRRSCASHSRSVGKLARADPPLGAPRLPVAQGGRDTADDHRAGDGKEHAHRPRAHPAANASVHNISPGRQ